MVTDTVNGKILERDRLKILFKETLKIASSHNRDALTDLKPLRRELREVDIHKGKGFMSHRQPDFQQTD